MANTNFGFLYHVMNSTFLTGFICGASIAWLFLKVRSKILPKNSVFSPENSSTFCEVSCARTAILYETCILFFKNSNHISIYIILFQPTGDGEDNFKLVLIVRSDLKMGKGKAAAQVQHVSWIMLQSIVDFSAE